MSSEKAQKEPPKLLSPARPKTFNELVEILKELPPVDEDFARDLEEIQGLQGTLPENPWAS